MSLIVIYGAAKVSSRFAGFDLLINCPLIFQPPPAGNKHKGAILDYGHHRKYIGLLNLWFQPPWLSIVRALGWRLIYI